MFRPSRPMMRPFMSSLGRSTTETVVSMACSAALRWMASAMICCARAAAVSRASASSRFTRLAASRRASASICAGAARALRRRSGRRRAAARAAVRRAICSACERGGRGAPSPVGERGVARSGGPARAGRVAASRSARARVLSASACSRRENLLAALRASDARLPRRSACAFSRASSVRFLADGLGVALRLRGAMRRRAPGRGRWSRRRSACGWRSTRRWRRGATRTTSAASATQRDGR